MYLLCYYLQVETIGDAYMVVGGLPEENPVHAECVANQALDMMYYCTRVVRPDSTEPIKVQQCTYEMNQMKCTCILLFTTL